MAAVQAGETDTRRATKVAYLDRLLPHVPLHRALARTAECLVFSGAELPAPVLDLGCGDGTFALAAFDGPPAVGLDPDRRALRYASRLGAYGSAVLARGEHLPFRDGAFGSVVCNSSLEHIPDEGAVLREMARVLPARGACVITVPSENLLPFHLGAAVPRRLGLPPLARLYEAWIRWVARIYHCDTPDGWRERLAKAGLQVESWRYYFTAGSTRAMDAAQYLSVPSLLTRRVLGRWVLWRSKGRYLPLARWLAGLVKEEAGDEGAFLYFYCRKR